MKGDYPRFTLRVPQELLDKLEFIARYESRTKTGEFEKEHGTITLKDLQEM